MNPSEDLHQLGLENLTLAEELFAVQAIYSRDVVKVAAIQPSHVSLEVHWPGNRLALQLRVLQTYPETSPIFLGVDNLSLSLDDQKKQRVSAFSTCLQQVFQPGTPCLFDLLQSYESRVREIEVDNPSRPLLLEAP